jgi:soluble lytic murein transglycosylase-like protein
LKKTDGKLYLTAALLCAALLAVLFSAVYLVLKEPTPKPAPSGELPIEYREAVKAASEKYGVTEARIYAVIQTESSF